MTDTQPAIAAPLSLHREMVRPDWIDYNGHMNVAYYVLAFDHATDALFDHLGIGPAYARQDLGSMFIVEAHVTYDREVTEGDPLMFTSQILGADAKRLHFFHRMIHAEEGFQAATTELMAVHVDLGNRRAMPMPDPAQQRVAALVETHRALPWPAEAGRIIALPARKCA
jgi:acyl-CoA thioester hydrolase